MNKEVLENIELEKAILGNVLADHRAIERIASTLVREDFNNYKSRIIFDIFLELKNEGLKVDLVSTSERGLANPKFDMDYFLDCSNRVLQSIHIETHIEQLKNLSVKRQLQGFGFKALKNATDRGTTGKENLADFICEAEELMNRVTFKKIKTFEQAVADTARNIIDSDGQPIGESTGFDFFDKGIGGACKTDLTIIAAEPGEGKTTLALNMAKHIAKRKKVIFFSLEMSEEQMIWKFMSDEFNAPVIDVRENKIDPEKLLNNTIGDLNIKIYDKGSMAVDEMSSIVRFDSIDEEIGAVFVDYLQLVQLGSYAKKGMNREQEVATVSRKLKQLAMDLKVPVFALSQLSRGKNRITYVLSDLRESGAIEQDANNVIFHFRPAYHNLETYRFDQFDEIVEVDDCVLIIAKCRLGSTGQRRHKFLGQYSRIEPYGVSTFPSYEAPNTDIKPNKDIPF